MYDHVSIHQVRNQDDQFSAAPVAKRRRRWISTRCDTRGHAFDLELGGCHVHTHLALVLGSRGG